MPGTICEKFLETVKKQSTRTAVMFKRAGRWNEIDWIGYRQLVESLAAGLQSNGVRKGDRVAILSNTRLEWAALDLAILGLGAVTVPIYQTSTHDDISFILTDSEAKVLVCETPAQLAKLHDVSKVRNLEKVFCIDSEATADSQEYSSLDSLQAHGQAALKRSPSLFELALRENSADDIASLIYTSGTTGQPKGVVITHQQILSEVQDAFPLLGVTFRDRSLCFLPFAHVLGRIEIWGHALIGYTMAFAESIEKLKVDLVEVEPTILVSVPRVFEKIYNGILAEAESSPIKRKMFAWALEVGRDISKFKVEKQSIPIDLALKYRLAKKLVFDAIVNGLGGRLRFAVCGGAPMSQPIAEFFHAAGVLILEGYGLTETTAAVAVNTPFDYRFGSVGKAVGDVRFKIADDGEILVSSKKVMREYYRDTESTKAVLQNGWLHTGDIGELSPEGYLKITDRKKDLIKTAGGKYVAPQKLDGLLKSSRFISNVHLHGDQRKYIVALITLNNSTVRKYAAEKGWKYSETAELLASREVRDLIRSEVAEANSHLASYETIKNFAILPHDFTVESGELTPSLKVKRKVVDKNYAHLINGLYGASEKLA